MVRTPAKRYVLPTGATGSYSGLVNWGEAGRVTDMGHAEYAADGSDKHQPAASPFKTVEEGTRAYLDWLNS